MCVRGKVRSFVAIPLEVVGNLSLVAAVVEEAESLRKFTRSLSSPSVLWDAVWQVFPVSSAESFLAIILLTISDLFPIVLTSRRSGLLVGDSCSGA